MTTIHVVLAPNAFKGTLTPGEAARAMAAGVHAVMPDAKTSLVPMADGGDGSLDAFVEAGFTRHDIQARDSSGSWHRTEIALQGSRAVVELAGICGIALPGAHPLRPMDASTLGVGDAVRAARDAGATSIALCLGGSASTDGGAGMLVALGAVLRDARGRPISPSGRDLGRVTHLDLAGLDPRLRDCDITVLADVSIPLHGPGGAAHVFAAQKGATPEQVEALDAGLERWGAVLESVAHRRVADMPGAGAAGGTTAAAIAVLDAEIRYGAQEVAELVGLPAAIASADLVITGEGRFDDQSLRGKGCGQVVELARAAGVPVLAVCGQVSIDAQAADVPGLTTWTIGSVPATTRQARADLRTATLQALAALTQATPITSGEVRDPSRQDGAEAGG